MTVLDELREHRLTRPDGRTVAWTEWGPPDGVPLLRLLAGIPQAELRLFGADEGHLAAFHREGEILDELLARG